MNDDEAMQRAIEVARQGIATGQSPFGAVIVKGGRVVGEAHNTVIRDNDPTAHAEVNALRIAAGALKSYQLRGCTLYASCEPCPMCLAASHWSKLDRVVYGAAMADASHAGFSELPVPAQQMAMLGESHIIVDASPLRAECARLFEEWKASGNLKLY